MTIESNDLPIRSEREWLAGLRDAAATHPIDVWLLAAIDGRLAELDRRDATAPTLIAPPDITGGPPTAEPFVAIAMLTDDISADDFEAAKQALVREWWLKALDVGQPTGAFTLEIVGTDTLVDGNGDPIAQHFPPGALPARALRLTGAVIRRTS